MDDIEHFLDGFIYFSIKNIQMKSYILKGFYDISINKTVYLKINMLSIKNENLHIYRVSSQIFSISMDNIKEFWIKWDYRKPDFRIQARN